MPPSSGPTAVRVALLYPLWRMPVRAVRYPVAHAARCLQRRAGLYGQWLAERCVMAKDYSNYEHLVCERPEPGILTITINNPESLNAISPPIHTELAHIWADVADDTDTRVVLLTGAGRAFSAGGDVHNMRATWRQRDVAATMREAKQIVDRMLDLPQPLIALVNGHAVGLGATLALICDVVIAADGAKIGDRHVNVGLVAGDGGALIWPLLVGPHRAKQFLLTGELIEARDAAAMGLINRAVPP